MTDAELLEIIAQAARENWTAMNLSGKGITTIPEEIKQLTNLQELNLSRNEITEIPETIGQLINLRMLNLRENKIKKTSIYRPIE